MKRQPGVHVLDRWAAPDRGFAAAACLAGASALGYALKFADGALHPEAITWLSAALTLALLALLGPRVLEGHGEAAAIGAAAAGLVLFVGNHLSEFHLTYLTIPHPPARYWFAAALLLSGAALSPQPWLGCLHKLLVIVAFLPLWLSFLERCGEPFIDLFVWHGIAWEALLRGQNPYALTMPNIYGHTFWFAPGLADATRVFVGYPYPPLSLLLAGAGLSTAGDYRYANLYAIILTASLMALSRRGRLGTAAAVLFLFAPRGLFVLHQGWTDSLCAFAFASVVFSACRAPRLLPWAFGMMLAIKQYFVLCIPLAVLLLPRPLTLKDALGFAWRAALVPTVLTLPFFFWNPKAFIDSVLLFQVRQPFRSDALSFMASTAKAGLPTMPPWLGFVLLLPAYVLSIVRAPRSPFGFALASAVVFLVFFSFAKQAFCNYYFFVTAMLCCAAASLADPSDLSSQLPSRTLDPANP